VVTFKNLECTTQMSTSNNAMKGICQTAEDCGENNGMASGNCASGFGVCCFYKVDKCEGTVNIVNNITHIQNEEFPAAFPVASTPVAKTCTYSIKGASDICQIRLDFETGVFTQETTGACTTDTVTVTSPSGVNPPVICGTVTGSHMYVETGRSDTAATVAIAIGAAAGSRMWKIKITLLECNNPSKARADCLQYYTGKSGRMFSFNKEEGMIQNQNYRICIRQEKGHCSMQVSETNPGSTSPDSFQLDNAIASAHGSVGTDCTNSFLEIDNQRHCGTFFTDADMEAAAASVTDPSAPFDVLVVTRTGANIGTSFDLTYTQVPC